MVRTVSLHPGAHADLRQHARFIALRLSLAASMRWQTGIESTIGQLATDADRFPQADEAADLGIDLREQSHGRRPHVYRILFTIDGDTVNVLRVRHAAQDRLSEDEG